MTMSGAKRNGDVTGGAMVFDDEYKNRNLTQPTGDAEGLSKDDRDLMEFVKKWGWPADELLDIIDRLNSRLTEQKAEHIAAHRIGVDTIKFVEGKLSVAEARVADLEKARDTALVEINDAYQCFEAALFEGLPDRMAEISAQDQGPGTLPDLVQRRLLPARLSIDRARAALSTEARK
jgi:hypothetical protein